MINEIKQELFKMTKQHMVLRHTIALLLLILTMAIAVKTGKFEFLSEEKMVTALFNCGWLIVFFMVYLSSQIFSMEFRYGTIKNLLQKDSNRSRLFAVKVLTLAVYSVYLNLIAVILTVVLARVLFPSFYLEGVMEHGSALQTLFVNMFSSFIGMWLFASLSLMLSLLIKKESLAGMLGIAAYFLSSMIAGVQFILLDQFSWLRWNPFNMLNLANQLADSDMARLTQLSTSQMVIGSFIYTVAFILIARFFFKRKKV